MVPLGVVEGSLGLVHRPQHVLGQQALPQRRSPGDKGRVEGDHHRPVIGGLDAGHLIGIGIGAGHRVVGVHDHLVGEDEVVGRQRLAVRPGQVVPQREGEHLAAIGDPAVLHRGHLGQHHRIHLVGVVKLPRPYIPDLMGDLGEEHVGVVGIEGVEFLGEDEHRHFRFRRRCGGLGRLGARLLRRYFGRLSRPGACRQEQPSDSQRRDPTPVFGGHLLFSLDCLCAAKRPQLPVIRGSDCVLGLHLLWGFTRG